MSSVTPAQPPKPERPRVPHVLAAVALSLLLGLQPVTTDVYLPALPMLTRALGASMSAAQLTMSALLLSFGLHRWSGARWPTVSGAAPCC